MLTSRDGYLTHSVELAEEPNGAALLLAVTEGSDEPGSRSCTYIPADMRLAVAALLAAPRFDADARQLTLI